MMRREVEQLEVHLISFHVAGEVDLEAHLGENAVNLAKSLGCQVKSPANNGPTRQGDIQALCLQSVKQTGLVNCIFPLGKFGFQGLFNLIGASSDHRTLLFGQLAKLVKDAHKGRVAAQESDTPSFQILLVPDFGQDGESSLFDSI